MNRFLKGYLSGSVLFGMYGFTRGFRGEAYYPSSYTNPPKQLLLLDKTMNGIINGIFYMYPVFNLMAIVKLGNRVEIKLRGFDKNDYIREYDEYINVVCYDTL